MDELGKRDRALLLGAFAMALRGRRFSRKHHDPLAEGTIQNTISCVV